MVDSGTLYVVATPIGNLADITDRARTVLAQVDLIAAEDTRHTGKLLHHLGLKRPMLSLHDHNEAQRLPQILQRLQNGEQVALLSDAGTPLISDPGFTLVRAAQAAQIKVVPIPGPSALITALSVAGLPCERFVFEGFLPAKSAARRKRLQQLRHETRTLVFYESSHRIVNCLQDMVTSFSAQRSAVVARELTKQYETVLAGSLIELRALVEANANQRKGEFVLVVAGASSEEHTGNIHISAGALLEDLLQVLPAKEAARTVSRLSGIPKGELYKMALDLKS